MRGFLTAVARPATLSNGKLMPPLWLASVAVASGWAAVFSIVRWIRMYVQDPAANDFRDSFYAAKLGLEHGWSQIYNQDALRAMIAAHLSGTDVVVNSSHTYPNPPLLAWMVAPLTVLPYESAYVAWTLVGVAALCFAWWLICPLQGLARLTLLLLALALWPIHYSLVQGQPTPEILALVAGAWWLIKHDRPMAAGVALAVATAIKPQDVILVPVALLVSGQTRVFLAWAGGCVVLALLFIASLGTSGLSDFWRIIVEEQSDPWHQVLTLAFVAGPGLPALILQVASAVAALCVAWRRRSALEVAIAVGLVGSVLSSVHEHETDAAVLVLAGWLVLRASGAALSRVWLLPGIIAIQAMSIGLVWPIFTWELIWLLLLGLDRTTAQRPWVDKRPTFESIA